MSLPELWFVYDPQETDVPPVSFFLTREGAQKAYETAIKDNHNLIIGHDQEWNGDETVYFGRIHAHAQVVPVRLDDEGEEIFDLVSYACEVK